jgi:hypothetical protein
VRTQLDEASAAPPHLPAPQACDELPTLLLCRHEQLNLQIVELLPSRPMGAETGRHVPADGATGRPIVLSTTAQRALPELPDTLGTDIGQRRPLHHRGAREQLRVLGRLKVREGCEAQRRWRGDGLVGVTVGEERRRRRLDDTLPMTDGRLRNRMPTGAMK